jgi:NADPH:quinone reductase-like Zn-dependent oxidoreductase
VHDGSFGELATPTRASISVTPVGVTDLDAGSLGVAGTTAFSAVDAVKPDAGARVLVVGATGGVGTFAIQLAARRGARMIATVLPGDEGLVTDLGAAETIDYTGDVVAAIRELHPDGIDGLIDAVNRDPSVFADLAGLVRDGGHATSVVGGAGEATAIGGVTVSNVGGNSAHLPKLAGLVAAGDVRVAINRTYPLDDAAQALADFAAEHSVGKRVIAVA